MKEIELVVFASDSCKNAQSRCFVVDVDVVVVVVAVVAVGQEKEVFSLQEEQRVEMWEEVSWSRRWRRGEKTEEGKEKEKEAG